MTNTLRMEPASVSFLDLLSYLSSLFHHFGSRARRLISVSSLLLYACAIVSIHGIRSHMTLFPPAEFWAQHPVLK